ncbi:MAG: Nif3-like dinuclear metal center hexameric protein [Deltaproteobacteria bacterium]|nr:MAG: Nif3-like dinuclear metal center hexameric protein [Deltaproteobacteria bacterium]
MQLTVKKLIDIINGFAPFDLAEDWDNSGLQAGDPDGTIQKIMVSLDVSMAVMEAACDWGADLVLSHHPLQMTPVKSIDFNKMPGSAIGLAAREHISILSAHTNLDKAADGLNDYFAEIMGIDCDESLCPDSIMSDLNKADSDKSKEKLQGIGRIGDLKSVLSLQNLALHVKERLGLEHLRVIGNLDLQVTRAAICTGSGGSLIDCFLGSSADVYITGDVKYHEARQVEMNHKGLIDVGHFASEVIVVDLLESSLAQALASVGYDIKIQGFKKEKDPFKTV